MPVLVSYVTCLCVTGITNIITVPILDCIAIISHVTALVVIAPTLGSTVWSTNPFRLCQKGEDMSMTLFPLVCLV